MFAMKKCFISGPLNKFSEQMSSEKRSQRAKQGKGGVHKVGDGLQGVREDLQACTCDRTTLVHDFGLPTSAWPCPSHMT